MSNNMGCRNFKLLVLICVLVLQMSLAACGGGSGGSSGAGVGGSDPAPTFPVVVFTDLHFNPFYDPSLFSALKAADSGQWASIFQTSGVTTPSAWGADTNYPLLALTMSAVRQNSGASPLVIFTGDILGHYLPQTFYTLNGSSVLNPTPADVAAMKAFTDKAVAFVMAQVRAAAGSVPVMFALGNADSYTGLGPDATFLANTAQLYYTQFLNGTVDRQAFLSTFTAGGYYSADMANTDLTLIGMNTFEFSPPNPYMSDMSTAVYAQLDWLDSALASARTRGRKVWLLMHVPPGADIYSTARSADSNGRLTSATMMWNADYQTRFLQILSRYPGLVTFTLGAHTHMDEYRIVSDDIVLDTTPGIAPYFGNNPAFKVFTVSRGTLKALDYRSLNYDLATRPAQFDTYYTFSSAYSLSGYLSDSLMHLYPWFRIDPNKQASYRGSYFSGHNYTVPTGNMSFPITDTTWPVYSCGIGNMDAQSLIDCVNSY
jgi:hypothetical protein